MDCFLVRDTPLAKVSCIFVHHFLSHHAYRQTEGQTNKQKKATLDIKAFWKELQSAINVDYTYRQLTSQKIRGFEKNAVLT